MSLYERFKDEADFQDKFVKPLLNRLGFYGVSALGRILRKLERTSSFPNSIAWEACGIMRHRQNTKRRSAKGSRLMSYLAKCDRRLQDLSGELIPLEIATYRPYTS